MSKIVHHLLRNKQEYPFFDHIFENSKQKYFGVMKTICLHYFNIASNFNEYERNRSGFNYAF